MYYELYIDVLFLENFMMDSLLLLAVNRVLKCNRTYGRIFLGGALGSLLTCLVIAFPFPTALKLIFFHVVINSLMLIAGLKISHPGQFAKAFLLLYLSAVFMGGIMYLFRPYMRYASLFYALAAVSYFLFTKLWRIVSAIMAGQQRICEVLLCIQEEKVQVRALLDTGNVLSDPVSGDPVSILDPDLAVQVIGILGEEPVYRYIPYRCVGGESIMKVFRIDKMCVHMDAESWIDHPLLGVAEQKLSADGEYRMILNCEYLNN